MELNKLLDNKIFEIKSKLGPEKTVLAEKIAKNLNVYIKDTGYVTHTLYISCRASSVIPSVTAYVAIDIMNQTVRGNCYDCQIECEHVLAILLNIKGDEKVFFEVQQAVNSIEYKLERKKFNQILKDFSTNRDR